MSSIITKLEAWRRQKRAKIKYKVDVGSDGNLVPLDIFKILFPMLTMEHLTKPKDKRAIICMYNKSKLII